MLKRTLALLVLMGTVSVPLAPAMADVSAGSYLAGRQAGGDHDYRAAAQYFARALLRDPSNSQLLENGVLAFAGAGQVDRAVPLAQRLRQIDDSRQIANMVLLAEAVKTDDLDAAYEFLQIDGLVSPLVDGLALAWVQLGRGDMSDAIGSFDAVAASPGLAAFGVYHKALALATVGDFEGADQIFAGDTGVNLTPTRRSIIAHTEVLSQLDRNEDALQLIAAVFGTDLDPTLQALTARLSAGETLPMSVVRNPSDGLAEVFHNVAGVLRSEAEPGLTLIYSRMAEYLRPDHVDAILMSAHLLEELGRYELATETYDTIPRDDPSFHAAELGRAETLRLSGNTEASIEALRQLSEALPDQPGIHVELGDALRRLERYDEASKAYDKAIETFPEGDVSWVVYFARGITHEREDRWEQAEADFRYALTLQPDQPQVLNYLGYSLVEMQTNLDEALDMIERAVAARPNDGYITDSLGWVLYRLGRYEEAVVHMERAAELTPVDPIINDHLGDVYWAVGRKREAAFQWNRALSFEPEDTDAERIRRKLDVGLDVVLAEEGADPITLSNDG